MVEISYTEEQQIVANIFPRIAAIISICCALYIIITVLRSKYYRSRIYHRIMLGCGVNIIVFSMTYLWGTAALPVETHRLGAAGNTATCSTYGFFFQYTMFITPSYYFGLSIVSVLAIRNKFDFFKVAWVEKWIHIGVHAFPLSSASYLLSIEAYNPMVNACGLASIPLECGNKSGIICERGPQNVSQLRILFWGVPTLLIFSLSTFGVIFLYFYVRSGGEKNRSIALSVCRQIGLYILILVAMASFRFIDLILTYGIGRHSFVINLLANINGALNGMWVLITYYCFRSQDPIYLDNKTISESIDDESKRRSTDRLSSGSLGHEERSTSRTSLRSSLKLSMPVFSIFDGNTVPSDSPWAEFLTEGEDEDYERGRIWRQ